MKERGIYLLLGLFFASLVGLWSLEYARVPTLVERDRKGGRVLHGLLDLKPDDLRKIEILGGEDGLMVFERREGNRWQMTAPKDAAADPSKVETLAYNLKELSRRPESANLAGDPGQHGLAPPERIVKLWGPATDAPLASLDIGLASLDRRYVRPSGTSEVQAVDARGLDLLRLPAGRWRDHEIFRVPSFEVDALKLSGGGHDLAMRRRREAWHVVEPVRLLAAEAKVDGLVADLGSLRVVDDTGFVADDVPSGELDRFGLKTPALTVTIESAARGDRRRAPQVLLVGKPVEGQDDKVYAMRGDQDDVVMVDRRFLKDLKPDVNNFRSPKVADISVPRVARVGVEVADGASTEAVRMGNDWAISAPVVARGDRQAVQDFLKGLDQLQTSIYLGPSYLAASGLEKPSMTLRIWQARDPRDPTASATSDPKGDLALVLKIGRRDAARKSIYAQIEGDSTILALPDTAESFLPRNPLAFRDRQVLAVESDQVERLKLIGPGRKVTLNAPVFRVKKQNLGLAPFGWWMVEPVDAPADATSVGKLLHLLGTLRAEALVTETPGPLARYGLDTPALTVTWSTSPGFSMVEKPRLVDRVFGTVDFENHSLKVGATLPDRPNFRYAQLSDDPLVFTLGPEALAVLDQEFRDHRVFSIVPDRVREVRLEWPDRGAPVVSTLDPSTRQWSVDPGSDAPGFDPNMLNALLAEASKLKTTRYFQHLGDFPQGTGFEPARLTIRLAMDDGSPARMLRIGARAGQGPGQAYASTDLGLGGAVFLLPEAPFAGVLRAPRRSGDLPDNVFAR